MGADKKGSKTLKSRKKTRARRKAVPVPLHVRLLHATEEFLSDLECAREMFEVITPIMKKQDDARRKTIERKLKAVKGLKEDDGIDKVDLLVQLRSLYEDIRKLTRADLMFRNQSVVLLVSQFGEFLSDAL